MAAPKKKAPVKKPPVKKAPVKKPPVKKAPVKKPDVKSPAGTNRLQNIINEGAEGRRLPVQEASPKRLTFSQPEKVRMNFMDKLLRQGTPNRANPPGVINQGYTPGSASRAVVPSTATSASATVASSAGSKTLAFLRGGGKLLVSFGSRAAGAAGAIVDPTFLSGKGEGKLNNDPVTRYLEASSTMSSMYKKQKREIRQGSKLAVTGVKEGTTRRLATTGSRKPAPGTNYTPKKRLENRLMKPAPGTNYSGQGTTSGAAQNKPTTTRPKPMNTKAADYAAKQQGQNQGQVKAKSAAPKPRPSQVASSAPVGRLSRTEREGLSTDRMQRKPKGNLLSFLKKRK